MPTKFARVLPHTLSTFMPLQHTGLGNNSYHNLKFPWFLRFDMSSLYPPCPAKGTWTYHFMSLVLESKASMRGSGVPQREGFSLSNRILFEFPSTFRRYENLLTFSIFRYWYVRDARIGSLHAAPRNSTFTLRYYLCAIRYL